MRVRIFHWVVRIKHPLTNSWGSISNLLTPIFSRSKKWSRKRAIPLAIWPMISPWITRWVTRGSMIKWLIDIQCQHSNSPLISARVRHTSRSRCCSDPLESKENAIVCLLQPKIDSTTETVCTPRNPATNTIALLKKRWNSSNSLYKSKINQTERKIKIRLSNLIRGRKKHLKLQKVVRTSLKHKKTTSRRKCWITQPEVALMHIFRKRITRTSLIVRHQKSRYPLFRPR